MIARLFCLLAFAAWPIAVSGTAHAEGHRLPAIPYVQIGKDIAGSTIADIAFHSPHPVLIVAGATYKLTDLAHDIGDAAVERENHWIGAEIVLADEDAKRLKQIKSSGGDLNGPDATAIKERLHDRVYMLTAADRSPYGYTTSVIVKNFPYAVAQVGVDRIVEETIGLGLKKIGVFKLVERMIPLPKKLNWLMNYGGPLEEFEKAEGWGKLGTRARDAEKAAEDAMREQEEKLVADYLGRDRLEDFKRSAADALGSIYMDIMREHPSQPRTIVASSFRLEAAREAVLLPAPVPVMVPAMPAATPAIVPAVPATAAPVAPDQFVRTIQADDAMGWQRYSPPPQRQTDVAPAASEPTEQPNPEDQARWAALHQELMQVGDGKTFAVCSNGCPATSGSSWDGGSGQTLYGR